MTSRDIETLTAGLPYDPGQIGEAPDWRADAGEFKEINQRIKSLQARPFSRNRILTGSGTGAEIYHGTRTNWITFDCYPVVSNGRIGLDEKADACSVSPLGKTNTFNLDGHATMENNGGMILSTQLPNDSSSNLVLVINAKLVQQRSASLEVETNSSNKGVIMATSPGREAIYSKLNRIHLDTVSYQNLPLSEVIRNLREQSRLRDPDKTGINFLYNPNIGSESAPADPPTGLPVQAAPAAPSPDAAQININIPVTVNLTDVSLANLLDAICLIADHPIKYSIEDYGVVFFEAKTDPIYRSITKREPLKWMRTNFFRA